MTRKIYWGVAILILLLICVAGVFLQLNRTPAEPEVFYKVPSDRSQPQPEQKRIPKEHGHVHEDSTFHVGDEPEHVGDEPEPIVPVSRDYEPTRVQIPEGISDPKVKAAWKRLDYIANNIWEWGGVPSQRAVELIDILMPPPDGFSGPTAHQDVEDTINLLGELAWSNDPRAAEVVATYLCEGIIGGNDPIDALVSIGPPAVPYLVHYLLDLNTAVPSRAVNALGLISERYRKDLGGIVDYIIIPRFEMYAALENPSGVMHFTKEYALEALSRLK